MGLKNTPVTYRTTITTTVTTRLSSVSLPVSSFRMRAEIASGIGVRIGGSAVTFGTTGAPPLAIGELLANGTVFRWPNREIATGMHGSNAPRYTDLYDWWYAMMASNAGNVLHITYTPFSGNGIKLTPVSKLLSVPVAGLPGSGTVATPVSLPVEYFRAQSEGNNLRWGGILLSTGAWATPYYGELISSGLVLEWPEIEPSNGLQGASSKPFTDLKDHYWRVAAGVGTSYVQITYHRATV